MTFSVDSINSLKQSVSARLSQKRFSHTASVACAAVRLAEYCIPEFKSEIEVAAFLHDITKEYTYEENINIIRTEGLRLDAEDFESPAILHAFTAPEIIKREFPEFATERIISAVYNHTIGAPDMSLIDEIIFLADFIDDTRTYDASIELRKYVWESMKSNDVEANIKTVHKACIKAIDFTLINLIENKKQINSKNILTRNALLSKI
jgi:predicted HD superfamily hydrolase involved in NAD metabolism